jgi:hypothetical protein
MVAGGSSHRRRQRPRRRPHGRGIGVLATTAALSAVAFSLLSAGTSPANITASAADGVGILGQSTSEQAASRALFRDASAIQTLNDPDGAAGDTGSESPRAASALAQDQARAQTLVAAAAQEAQAAAARQATTAAPAPAADAGTAGPDAYRAYARAKVGATQFACLDSLWNRESGWRPSAQNPSSTAYGIPQLLNATWKATGVARTSNGYRQVDAGLIYIAAAYGTPCAAWAHSKATGWY